MLTDNNASDDCSEQIRQQVAAAVASKTPLRISAGNSKSFYGNHVDAQKISVLTHHGIIEYQPTELVVTVRSGTRLKDLQMELKANNQMLAFEPPEHSEHTTIGGVIACGLSGPGCAAFGSARDFVLGITVINGKAEKLKFGGQVMKNVAGYDASRLMVGAQGTLGVLLDISIKVLPVKESEKTLKFAVELNQAIHHLQLWVKKGLPITASCYYKDTLYLRLGSTSSAVKKTLNTINKKFSCEEIDTNFWLQLKNQTHDFFSKNYSTDSNKLWRCSHQTATERYGDTDNQLIEWNGALRWLASDENMHIKAAEYGGHATRYPIAGIDNDIGSDKTPDIFQPLQPGLLKIHQHLKQAFDPDNILNPHRLYTDL